jgi:hypothetical protein
MPPQEALPAQSPSEHSSDFIGFAPLLVMPPQEALPAQSLSGRSSDFYWLCSFVKNM